MPVSRRDFLKISGLALAGFVVGKPAMDSLIHSQVAAKSASAASSAAQSVDPSSKKRLAMALDVRACTAKDGCRTCIDLCNYIHNIPDFGEPKDQVKWLWTTSYQDAFGEAPLDKDLASRPILVTCNECDNPPCVRVCPTQATFKRNDGVVVIDEHRCIGCRYCMAACPYGSRSFNWRDPRPFIKKINPSYPTRERGVVEKCDFCMERLAIGQEPACVEVCPQQALIFGDMDDPNSAIQKTLRSRFSIVRKPELGTKPQMYYLV